MSTRENLREWLAAELEVSGRSQSGLARFMGLDQSAVNRMVAGKRAIKAHELPIIQRYLAQSGGGQDARVTGLTGGELSKRPSALAAFPAVLGAVSAATLPPVEALADLVDSGNDYALVMLLTRDLEDALSSVLLSRIGWAAGGVPTADLDSMLGRGRKQAPIWAAEILENAHVIGPDELRRIAALFALRDAMVHSRRVLSLFDPAVRELVELVVPDPTEGLWRGSGFELRNAFLMGAIILAGRVRESIPTAVTEGPAQTPRRA